MTALPPALRPWAAQLEPFDAEVARALGGYLLRLAAAFGDLGRGRRGAAEPDGFGGISSRGPYDRLLATEWLLHDELPEEFVRRAAMGEQLFLERCYAEPQKSRHIVVLLDTGCEQLGAPRLVQLAWLILQRQRAEAAHAGFTWGVIQEPRAIHRQLAPSRVEAMLRDSQFRLPAREDLQQWAATIQEVGGRVDECEVWRVGGPHLLTLDCDPDAGVLCVEPEVSRERSPRLEVRCYAAGDRRRPKRTLHLEVPAPGLALRILREPMDRPTVRPPAKGARLKLHNGLVMHHGARRAWALTHDGALLTFHIPQSTREPAAPVRLTKLEQFGEAVAVGYSPAFRRSVVLCSDQGRATLVVAGKRGGVMRARPLDGDGVPPDLKWGARLGQLFVARSDLVLSRPERAESEEYLCVFADRLFHIASGSCNLHQDQEIEGFAAGYHGVLLAVRQFEALRIVKAKLSEKRAVRYDELGPPLEGVGAPPFLMAPEPLHTRRAYKDTAGKWIVRDAGFQAEFPVPEGVLPCAITHGAFGPELLAIGVDRTRLYRINVKGESLLLRFKHRIVDVAASQERLAVLIEAGQLFAYQLSPLAQLIHYEPEGQT